MKNILTVLAGLLILGIVGVIAVISRNRDIPAPDTTDLIFERPAVAPENNAYTYFLAATNSFYWPTNAALVNDYLDGKPCDSALIQELVARNAATIQAVGQGLKCGVCLTPEVTGFDMRLPYLGPWRSIGEVMSAKTKLDRLAGRYAEATSTCISLLQFGDMTQKDAGSLIHYLVGVAVLGFGLEQAQDLACDKGMSQEELTRLSGALAMLGPFDRGLVRALKVEYTLVVQIVDQFRDGKFGLDELIGLDGEKPKSMWTSKWIPGYFFQPNTTKLAFANLYRVMISNAPLCYADMKRYDVEASLGLKTAKETLFTKPNAAGRIMFDIFIPAVDTLLERKCRAECNVAATRLITACNAYAKKEGRLPDDLQVLVPACLAAIPADPYDGKPFRYSPSLGIVYSVGIDLKDSGGSSKVPVEAKDDTPAKRRWKAEDVVFEIKAHQ